MSNCRISVSGSGSSGCTSFEAQHDTKPETEIRKNGDLTFTVGLAGDYTVISKLVINGYDCINGKLVEHATLHGCDAVEARKNANGSYTVTIKNVTAVPDMSVEAHRVIIGDLDRSGEIQKYSGTGYGRKDSGKADSGTDRQEGWRGVLRHRA